MTIPGFSAFIKAVHYINPTNPKHASSAARALAQVQAALTFFMLFIWLASTVPLWPLIFLFIIGFVMAVCAWFTLAFFIKGT